MVKVELIDRTCVKDDGVLVMIPFREGLEITEYDSGEELFYFAKNDHRYINKYLEDERKKEFPYSDVPFHKTIKNFKIYNVVHQIFNYGTIYEIVTYKKNIIDDTDWDELTTVEKVVWTKSDYKYTTCFGSVIRDGSDSALFVVSDGVVPELEMTVEELKSLRLLNKVKFTIPNRKAISGVSNNKTDKSREEVKKLSKKLK